MKYFIPEYYHILNDPNSSNDEKNLALEKISNANYKYEEYLKENRNYFPRNFFKHYTKNRFHDYRINNIKFEFGSTITKKNKFNIIVYLSHHNEDYCIIHKNIINCDVSINDYIRNFPCDYLYGEFYKEDKNLWHHNFLFTYFYEINITCQEIDIKHYT